MIKWVLDKELRIYTVLAVLCFPIMLMEFKYIMVGLNFIYALFSAMGIEAFSRFLYKHRYQLSKQNIKAFIQGYTRYALRKIGLMPKWKAKQIDWRYKQIETKSWECITEGACKHCGCPSKYLVYADKSCPGKCYPEMLTKNQFNGNQGDQAQTPENNRRDN